ncbi:dTDP-4-dehydrorhamnose reductase [Ascidiaceihabitans sp.]|uniref:dTDP-4-dehydrorhamnose reductase n=1 Tax=Ascidiaceihabitans sp. TaxID=1872644 RepID=UPI0032995FA4
MILVFGQSGQVARELSTLPDVRNLGRDDVDLEYPLNCAEAIAIHKPAAVINAAAYTAVDAAEDNEARARMINAAAPEAMAQACADLGIPFVSISTDYVFDGAGNAPWREGDMPAPINAYGRSKLAGEAAIAEIGGTWAVLRTSWVVSTHGNNFVKTMLRLGAERDALTIVADQIGGLTPARDIARACHHMAQSLISEPNKGGIYHFSGTPNASWADVARAVFKAADLTCAVTDIPSSDYPTPALRPLNSRLDCYKIKKTFGIKRPDWRAGIADIVKELT